MRLIDADACIDDIRNNNQQAWEALAYAPTIDAVEVVRCKDCKHWHSNTEFCSIWSFQNIAQRTLSDDYCSRAERKEP